MIVTKRGMGCGGRGSVGAPMESQGEVIRERSSGAQDERR